MSDSEHSKASATPPDNASLATAPITKRLTGSCDTCRRRKVKCDSQGNQSGPCTNCRVHKIPCTHDIPTKSVASSSMNMFGSNNIHQKRGMKDYSRKVSLLHQRVKELEESLKQQDPQEVAALQQRVKDLEEMLKQAREPLTKADDPVSEITAPHERASVDPKVDADYAQMLKDMKKFSIAEHGRNDRFFGPSSNVYFMRQMMNLKGAALPVGIAWSAEARGDPEDIMKRPLLIFPEEDLMLDLFNLYFQHPPNYICVFHEPSFRRDVASGVHHLDVTFGAVVLMVCGVASRISTDPRVLSAGASEHSAGWQWVSQTMSLHNSFFQDKPKLHDIQYCCLLTEYMLGSSTPQSTWFIIGQGMRYAIELGLHRRRDEKQSAEGELKKRIFWTIYILDRHISFYHGRPVSIPDDDYDVEYPALCDDEYWDTGNPETDFKQPVNKPSRLEAFVASIKLAQITSFALRSVFRPQKAKEAVGQCYWNRIQNSVSLVDSMLNSWFNSIPVHLRWDMDAQPQAYFEQAAELYMTYYNLQIFIHRPFVHSPSALALPSLAICTNAARSCIRLSEIRQQIGPISSMMISRATFSAGSAIVMNMWHTVQAKSPSQLSRKDVDNFQYCLNALRRFSRRFHMNGYLADGLESFAEGLPLTSTSSPDHGGDVQGPPTLWAPSGYVPDPSLSDMFVDFSGLDSYGAAAAKVNVGGGSASEIWNGYPQADMSLFEAEDMDTWMNTASTGTAATWNDQWSGYLSSDFVGSFNNGVYI